MLSKGYLPSKDVIYLRRQFMKRNRLLIYLLIFTSVIFLWLSLKKTTLNKQYPEQQIQRYLMSLIVETDEILFRVPIEEISNNKQLAKDQLNKLLVSTERIFTSYTELQEINNQFHAKAPSTNIPEEIIAGSMAFFTEMKESKNRHVNEQQLQYLEQLYLFYKEINDLDVEKMDLDECIHQVSLISEKYQHLIK